MEEETTPDRAASEDLDEHDADLEGGIESAGKENQRADLAAVEGVGAGKHLRWSRLVKTVEVREASSGLLRSSIAAPTPESKKAYKKQGPTTKVILNGVSGSAAPGELLALMGPSGSGKTSLLDTISGRSSHESGVLSVDGEVVAGTSMKLFKSKVAYVKQADVFFGHLTVRDQLTYTALLRLPSAWEKSRKHEEVDRIINLLRLNKCADTQIMLCSGGEKKRVNIGTELLTDPSVIMLDEPTSGLDSTSAVALLHMLHDLAGSHGKTVVTSIHQPSSAVFRSFDRLMMLADGNVVYFGTPVRSLTYLKDQGFECPNGYNAADHWMDLLVVDSALDQEEPGQRRGRKTNTPRAHLIDSWDNEAVAKEIDLAVDGEADSFHSEEIVASDAKKYNTNWLTQFSVLTHRSAKNSTSAIFTPMNVVKSACIGIVVGLLWWQMDYTEKNINDYSSYYFFTMTFWVFDSMFTALMAFPSEREIIFKERASASYHLSAYFMAKTMSEAPTRLVLPFIYMVISYWMAGLNPRFSVFVGSTGCTLLSVMAGESLGLLVGASVMDFEKALTIMTVFALALMLSGGFFVQNIPSFMGWLKYLSPFKYAFDASQQLVFDRNVPCDGSGALEEICKGSDVGYATPEEVTNFLGVQGTVAFNVCILLVIILVARFSAYLALRRRKGQERS